MVNNELLKLYILELNTQCNLSMLAINDLEMLVSKYNKNVKEGYIFDDPIWYTIQNLLVCTANISKILWPQNNDERGLELRKLLKIDDKSPLASRKLRNHFEHFDERLKDWGQKADLNNFIDRYIGNVKNFKLIDIKNTFRCFDNYRWTVTFQGEEYQLIPIIISLKNLYKETELVKMVILNEWIFY